MPTDRLKLLRILSKVDQSLAKTESVIEREQTYDGWQAAIETRGALEDVHTRAIEALKRMA